jgi:hypothetical protein
LRASLARRPKVGARCWKSARRVLSGGRPARAVPTGAFKFPRSSRRFYSAPHPGFARTHRG